MKSIHTFVLAAKADGEIRIAQYNNQEHIVIPVVMMCEGVVWAVNSPFPALVLEEEFGKVPNGWNGRPVVGGHPYKHGEAVSANAPDVLEQNAFGFIFNTQVKNKRLCAEAWIDPVRASRPGSIGERTLERIKEGKEILEVSVGVFTDVEMKKGVFNGMQFEGIWRDYVPDHLAILAEGDIGACSVEMGCGAMRAATVHLVTSAGMKAVNPEGVKVKDTKKTLGIAERFTQFLNSFKAEVTIAEDANDNEVANLLDKALRASEPGYLGIDAVNSAEGHVVFAVMPADRFMLFRRDFTLEGATVTLGEERTEVIFKGGYEPVVNANVNTSEPKAAGCGCGGHKKAEETAVTPTAGENTDMNKTERIAALVAAKKIPALSVKVLETLTDEQIEALEKAEAPVADPKPEPVVEPKPQANASAPMTEEEYINAAPPAVRESLRESIRISNEKKGAMISRLKASGRCDYTDAELATQTMQGLERLCKLAGVQMISNAPVDFSLNAARETDDATAIPAAPSLVAAIQNKKRA